MDKCSIGIATKTDCHLKNFTLAKKLHNIKDLAPEDISLLKHRLDNIYFKIEHGVICDHHKCLYLDYFSRNYSKCCDSFSKHKNPVKDRLSIIDLQLTNDCLAYLSTKLVPGNKICKHCKTWALKEIDAAKLKQVRSMSVLIYI